MSSLTFIENRESIQPSNNDWELLPDGDYQAAVVSAEVIPTKRGDGSYLKIEHRIYEQGSSFDGRLIFTNLTLQNPNSKAQEIGLGQLSSLGQACGINGIPADSNEILEKFHYIRVRQVAGSGMNPKTGEPYGPRNEIKAFYKDRPALSKSAVKAKSEVTTAKIKLQDDEIPDFGFPPNLDNVKKTTEEFDF